VENFCELLWFVSLVPLGVGTTCLGTLDPLDYGHFMLNAVRHKNFYNTFTERIFHVIQSCHVDKSNLNFDLL